MSLSKIVGWIKKHKKLTVLSVGFIFIFPIVIIIYLNLVLSPSFFSSIGISTDSLISYIAGFEAFIGTVFLGVVAVRQNDKAISLNERMMQIEEKRDLLERQPSVMISNWLVDYVCNKDIESEEYDARIYKGIFDAMNADDDKSKYRFLQVTLNLINSSRTNIEFSIIGLYVVCKGSELHLKYSNYSLNAKQDFFHLCPNAMTSVTFLIEDEVNLKAMLKKCRLDLNLSNAIGETYIQQLEFSMFGVKPEFFGVRPENNSIFPFKPEKSDV
jgi:hypothetical protein